MIAADVQFRTTANAAAAAFARKPPYLAYKTDVVIDVPSLRRHKVISRAVETRTQDDYAVLQDLPQGQRQYGHSFPLVPTFDAISYASTPCVVPSAGLGSATFVRAEDGAPSRARPSGAPS